MSRFKFQVIFFCLLMTGSCPSASALDFKTVDAETFRLYSHGEWDSVISLGKQALHEDIDYFYLRFRMGASYYNIRKYYQAIEHFEKARKFNSTDELTLEYLYYSYREVGLVDNARAVFAGLSPDYHPQVQGNKGILQEAHVEGGIVFSSDNTIADKPYMMGPDSIYGEKDLYRNNYYASAGFSLNAGKRLSIGITYNYLDFSKVKYIQYTRYEDQLVKIADSSWGKMYIWSFPKVKHDTSFQYNTYQHELYLSLPVSLPARFRITPAAHIVYVKSTNITASFDTVTVMDTGYYVKYDSSWYLFPFKRNIYSYSVRDTSFFNYLGSLSLSYDFSVFRIGLSGAYSNFNGKTQTQAGLSLSYYPLGNAKLFGTTAVSGMFQKGGKKLVFSQSIGGEPLKNLWLRATFIYGDLTNGSISNGSIVYNNTDKINYMAGMSLAYYFTKHLGIYVIYQYFSKESTTWYYSLSNDGASAKPTIHSTTNKYNTNSIFGGITWKL